MNDRRKCSQRRIMDLPGLGFRNAHQVRHFAHRQTFLIAQGKGQPLLELETDSLKLDLARAEGVGLLAAAASRGEARRAIGLVRGELSRRVALVREDLLGALVELEARLDFGDELAAGDDGPALALLDRARRTLEALGEEVGAGRVAEGVPTEVPHAGERHVYADL